MEQVYYDEPEAAEYLRCSKHTLRIWRREKKHGLRAARAGKRVIYAKHSLDDFIRASTEAAEARVA